MFRCPRSSFSSCFRPLVSDQYPVSIASLSRVSVCSPSQHSITGQAIPWTLNRYFQTCIGGARCHGTRSGRPLESFSGRACSPVQNFEMGLNKCPMPFGTNLSCSVRISIFSHVLVKMSLNVPRDVKSEHTCAGMRDALLVRAGGDCQDSRHR